MSIFLTVAKLYLLTAVMIACHAPSTWAAVDPVTCRSVFSGAPNANVVVVKLDQRVESGSNFSFANKPSGIARPVEGLKTVIMRTAHSTLYEFELGAKKSALRVDAAPATALPLRETIETLDGYEHAPEVRASSWREASFVARVNWERRLERDCALGDLFRLSMGQRAGTNLPVDLLHESVEKQAVWEQVLQKRPVPLGALVFAKNEIGDVPMISFGSNDEVAWAAGGFRNLFGVYKRVEGTEETLDAIREFMRALSRHSALFKLEPKKVGVGLHLDRRDGTTTIVYALDGAQFLNFTPKQAGLRNLPTDIWRKIIEIYRERFLEKISRQKSPDDRSREKTIDEFERKLSRALAISHELIGRSSILAWSEDPVATFTQPRLDHEKIDASAGFLPENEQMPEHIPIRGAITAVFSKGAHEPLPSELLLGVQLPRDGGTYVEMGRLGVEKGQILPMGDRLFRMTEALIGGAKDVRKIIIHCDDELHRKMWMKRGFTEMRLDQKLPEGTTILEADPRVLLQGLFAP